MMDDYKKESGMPSVRASSLSVCLLITMFCSVFLGFHTQRALGADQAQWGEVTYPLLGNLRSKQGTILCLIRIEEPLTGEVGSWRQPTREGWKAFVIMQLKLSDKNDDVQILWSNDSSGRGFITTYIMNLPGLLDKKRLSNPWKMNEEHLLGYTWDASGKHTLYLDGKMTSQIQDLHGTGLGLIDEKNGQLVLGDRSHSNAITFYAVSVLGEALTREEMADPVEKLFVRRDSTLLLDCFDQNRFKPDGKHQTTAKVISGFSGEQGGTPDSNCYFVQIGKRWGLRLYTPPVSAEVSSATTQKSKEP